MLYRGLNKYHFVPEYQGSERTSVMLRMVPTTSVIVPLALICVIVMVLWRVFHV